MLKGHTYKFAPTSELSYPLGTPLPPAEDGLEMVMATVGEVHSYMDAIAGLYNASPRKPLPELKELYKVYHQARGALVDYWCELGAHDDEIISDVIPLAFPISSAGEIRLNPIRIKLTPAIIGACVKWRMGEAARLENDQELLSKPEERLAAMSKALSTSMEDFIRHRHPLAEGLAIEFSNATPDLLRSLREKNIALKPESTARSATSP